MFQTNALVEVKNGDKVLGSREYQKTIFHGTYLNEKGNVVKDPAVGSDKLLGEAIAFYQSLDPKGDGVLALLQDATYAYDLGQRSKVRQAIQNAIAGPDKAIEKAVDQWVNARTAMGKTTTAEQIANYRQRLLEE